MAASPIRRVGRVRQHSQLGVVAIELRPANEGAEQWLAFFKDLEGRTEINPAVKLRTMPPRGSSLSVTMTGAASQTAAEMPITFTDAAPTCSTMCNGSFAPSAMKRFPSIERSCDTPGRSRPGRTRTLGGQRLMKHIAIRSSYRSRPPPWQPPPPRTPRRLLPSRPSDQFWRR